jgi:beta-lactamase regulating signal transducer with metallopeptidase domain
MSLLADALSAALVHSLWQNSIVAILLWMTLAVVCQRSANARYAVSCAALTAMVAIPIVTAGVLYARALPVDPAATAIVASTPVIAESVTAIGQAPVTRGIHEGNWMSWLQAWALPVWCIGVLVFSLRLVSASAHAIALKRRGEPADEALVSIVSALATRMGVTRSVTVLVSTMTGSPATLGWIRPVILLPPATALGITPRQLEALLAHELAHIRRYDYLVNVLQLMAETACFYHPAVWWASKRIRAERESAATISRSTRAVTHWVTRRPWPVSRGCGWRPPRWRSAPRVVPCCAVFSEFSAPRPVAGPSLRWGLLRPSS